MTDFAFNPDNSMKRPTAAELEAADGNAEIICLIQGSGEAGQAQWAYVGVKPSLYAQFIENSRGGVTMNLDDYGRILRLGDGIAPPADVAQAMREQYGFDENYVENLAADAKKQQDVHFNKKESLRIDNIVAMLKAGKPS